MSIAASMLPEFDQEMATTRKVLERVPDDKLDYKPHAKSMTFTQLASHIAEMVGWVGDTMKEDSFDMAPVDGPKWEAYVAKSNADLLSTFDKNAAAARAALAAGTDEAMMKTWSLLSGGNVLFSMPRVACIRGMLLNHVIHHRGQLSVYLRLNDIPVPSIYGPSADEGQM
ncbi:MAG: DinB family protein [Bryobacterales bacterium]|nr:DinB family protein [Bryobacterales bacterium]